MIASRYLLLVTSLILISADGRELLRRSEDVTLAVSAIEIDVERSSGEQRRELSWGTGTFAWLMYSMKLCHGKGPLCPPPPCHLGPKPPGSWNCNNTDVSEAEEEEVVTTTDEYEETDESSASESTSSVSSGTSTSSETSGAGARSSGYSSTSIIGYIVGAAALVAITAAIVFKKRKGVVALSDENSIEGSVARRMELLGGEVPSSISVANPPTFIELGAVHNSSNMAAGGGPVTNYVNV